MGEYARSLAIARAAAMRWPAAAIHFVLSRQAAYAAEAPFAATLLPSSPTFHSDAVRTLIADFRPDVVVFDNAGRTAQLRAARAGGAAVVYISARRRQWKKAQRLRWLRLIDEHWVAYPKFLSPRPNIWDACKRRFVRAPTLRHLDVVMPAPDAARRRALLERIGIDDGGAVVVVPGGGTGHPGAADATARFLEAAAAIAASGTPTVFVGPAAADGPGDRQRLRRFASLPQADLVELLRAARLVVVNGGSTLLQAIACGAACLAAPIAKDQAARIARAAAAGVALAAPLDGAGIARRAQALLGDEPARAALARRAAALKLADGIEVAVDALAGLVERARGAHARA